jgi:hypothetical protein
MGVMKRSACLFGLGLGLGLGMMCSCLGGPGGAGTSSANWGAMAATVATVITLASPDTAQELAKSNWCDSDYPVSVRTDHNGSPVYTFDVPIRKPTHSATRR